MKLQSFAFENEIYFENQIILEFHPPTEFARDTILFIVVRSLSSEQNCHQTNLVHQPQRLQDPNLSQPRHQEPCGEYRSSAQRRRRQYAS